MRPGALGQADCKEYRMKSFLPGALSGQRYAAVSCSSSERSVAVQCGLCTYEGVNQSAPEITQLTAREVKPSLALVQIQKHAGQSHRRKLRTKQPLNTWKSGLSR